MTKAENYCFEGKARKDSQRTREASENALNVFAGRLQLGQPNQFNSTEKELLLDYMIHCALNIDWYENRIKKEKRLRFLFTAITLFLLALLPIILFFVSAKIKANAEVVTAQITTALTGFLAVHKALSSWLEKRKVMGLFWSASSELKENLYSIESKWKGKAREKGRLKEEFMADIQQGVTLATAVVKKEQKEFFETNYALPSTDFAQLVKDSSAAAKDMSKILIPTSLQEKGEKEKQVSIKDQAIKKIESSIEQVKELMVKCKTVISDSTDSTEKATASERLKSLTTKLASLEDQLVDARAERSIM